MTRGIYNKFWSIEDVAILRFFYPNRTNTFIADFLGKKEMAVMAKAFKLRLLKDKQFILDCSKKSQFKPGNISHNKGKKQVEYMSPEGIERSKASRFSKGHLPHNTREQDGELSLRKDTKTGITYIYIRTGLAVWELLQRFNYRKFIGDIPDGYIVRLKDGDPMNCHPFNLELISQRENMLLNSIQRYPPELISTLKALSKLKKMIKKYGTEQIS